VTRVEIQARRVTASVRIGLSATGDDELVEDGHRLASAGLVVVFAAGVAQRNEFGVASDEPGPARAHPGRAGREGLNAITTLLRVGPWQDQARGVEHGLDAVPSRRTPWVSTGARASRQAEAKHNEAEGSHASPHRRSLLVEQRGSAPLLATDPRTTPCPRFRAPVNNHEHSEAAAPRHRSAYARVGPG